MARKSLLTKALIIAVILVILIGIQVKFKPINKIMDKISGKKAEEAKPGEKKEGEAKEGEKAEGEKKAQEEEQEPVGVKVVKAQNADFKDHQPVLG
jgi:hypothetical protein